MATLAIPQEQRFVFDDVDWTFYQSILDKVGDRHVFVTYDGGRLEILAPSMWHESRARHIGILINLLAEELNIAILSGGSATFKRQDIEKGVEPDQCFYIENRKRVGGKREIDLMIDPPPDLAVEVEITRRLASRVKIYEQLGVSELWRDDGETTRIFELSAARKYEARASSIAFPMIPAERISQLLNLFDDDETAWMRTVRQWVRDNLVGR